MSEQVQCKACGSVIPTDAPEGICPKCAYEAALGGASGSGSSQSAARVAVEEEEAEFRAAQMEELATAFPQFELLELLGRGGMGEVYKARQKKLDRIVAIKVLPEPFGKLGEFTERFLREARSLARLSHPNIVTIYDYGESNGVCYFVMEFVDGVDLRRMIEAHTLTPEEALRIVPQICDALQFAHDQAIVHRDIKPANILVDKHGRVKIADFGLAKIVKREPEDLTLTVTGGVMGTPEYMAPEQRRASQEVDHRADIYSLGVVFYEMLTGEVPMGKFDPPSLRAHVDVRLDEVVLRTLEREPERRYQHVSEVKTGVETITGNPPSQFSPAEIPPPTETAKAPGPMHPMTGQAPGTNERIRRAPTAWEQIENPPASRPSFLKWVALPIVCFLLLTQTIAVYSNSQNSLALARILSVVMILVIAWGIRWQTPAVVRKLKSRDLPPHLRSRMWRQIGALIAGVLAATVAVIVFLPQRVIDNNEGWFVPNSGDFQKVTFAGSFTSYGSLLGATLRAAPKTWNLQLRILTKENTSCVMNVALPSLRAEYDLPAIHGSQMTSVLDLEAFTAWLHDEVKLDTTSPKSQAEAKEIVAVLKRYEIIPPQTWNEFINFAEGSLTDFYLGGFGSKSNIGAIDLTLFLLPLLIAAYSIILYRINARLLAAARVEIAAGRWTPPEAVRNRLGPFMTRNAIWLLLGLSAIFALLWLGAGGRKAPPAAPAAPTVADSSDSHLADFYEMGKQVTGLLVSGSAILAPDARKLAGDYLAMAKNYPTDWNYGNAIHDANSLRGLADLSDGNTDQAAADLLLAGDTPGSPQLNTFGPNLRLASKLLAAGAQKTVLQYFEKCSKFWKMGAERLARFRQTIKEGGVPEELKIELPGAKLLGRWQLDKPATKGILTSEVIEFTPDGRMTTRVCVSDETGFRLDNDRIIPIDSRTGANDDPETYRIKGDVLTLSSTWRNISEDLSLRRLGTAPDSSHPLAGAWLGEKKVEDAGKFLVYQEFAWPGSTGLGHITMRMESAVPLSTQTYEVRNDRLIHSKEGGGQPVKQETTFKVEAGALTLDDHLPGLEPKIYHRAPQMPPAPWESPLGAVKSE